MPLLKALEVIWMEDDFIKPPGPKMIVCVAPEPGFFFRINTRPRPVAVRLLQVENTFLKHDSYLECDGPLEIDDYTIETFLSRNNGRPLGAVATSMIPAIWAAVEHSQRIREDDKVLIRIGLGLK